MPVEPAGKLLDSLLDAAQRMRRVREAASALSLIRRGDEPNPTPLLLGPSEPQPGFSGQPERSDFPR